MLGIGHIMVNSVIWDLTSRVLFNILLHDRLEIVYDTNRQ